MKRPSVKNTLEVVALCVGIPTALVATVALGPHAWRATHERESQYAILQRLHAGYSVDFITSKLGSPTTVTQIVNDSTVKRQLSYIKRDYAVTVVVDSAGSAVTYAVFACNPGFQPTFVSPARGKFKLNATSLRETVLVDSEGGDERPDSRQLRYVDKLTPGSPGLLTEIGEQSGSGFSLYRSYMIGVNEACGASINYGEFQIPEAVEDLSKSNARSLKKFRSTAKPNYYFESVRSNADVDENGCLVLDRYRPRAIRVPTPPWRLLADASDRAHCEQTSRQSSSGRTIPASCGTYGVLEDELRVSAPHCH